MAAAESVGAEKSSGMTVDMMSDDTPPSAQQAPSFAACHQVINTAELLEMVLLGVDDMRTLLLSQRVSKNFKDAIESSPALQMKLWMREDPKWNNDPGEDALQVNPLLEFDVPWTRLVSRKARKPRGDGSPFFGLVHRASYSFFNVEIAKDALYKRGSESWHRMMFARTKKSKLHLCVTACDWDFHPATEEGGFFCIDGVTSVDQLLDLLAKCSSDPAWCDNHYGWDMVNSPWSKCVHEGCPALQTKLLDYSVS